VLSFLGFYELLSFCEIVSGQPGLGTDILQKYVSFVGLSND